MLAEDYVTFACCCANLKSVPGKIDGPGIDLRRGAYSFADNISALSYFMAQSGWEISQTIKVTHRLPLIDMSPNTPKWLLVRPADRWWPAYCKSFRHAG